MAQQTEPRSLDVSLMDVAVAPKSESVGVFVTTEELDPFILKFSQSDARKLVTKTLDALKVLIGVSPPTKAGEQATVVEKWEIGKAFPDRVWFVLHSLAYGRQSYSFLPTDAKAIAKQLVESAEAVEKEQSKGPQH